MSDARQCSKSAGLALWVCTMMIGGVFVLSGVGKAYQPELFLGDVEKYRLVNGMTLLFLAGWLPWIEIVLGCCVLKERTRREACYLALILLAIFTFAQISVVTRGLNAPCGCFVGTGLDGDSSAVVSFMTIMRTIGLGIVVGVVIMVENRKRLREGNHEVVE